MAQLAADVIIYIGDEAIEIRPCLRYAMRLDRREGSFAQLSKEIMDGSLTAICEIIRDHYEHPFLETRVLDTGIDQYKWPLITYLGQCLGYDYVSDQSSKAETKGKPQTTADFLTGLYRIGTGWLGWTPDATLYATPAEIIEAQHGRMDMLKAIFGESKPSKPGTMGGFTDANVMAVFQRLGATVPQGDS